MNTTKNKTTEKKYILSADLPFGNLKKDTIFTYNAITKVASFPNGVQISDFDISDSKFVKKCVDISFKIGDIVLYETILYRITNINYINGICSIHEVYSNKDIPRVKYHHLKPVTFYYFINSSGKISSSYIGKDPAADSWRALTNNLFYTKDEAVKYRDYIFKINNKRDL